MPGPEGPLNSHLFQGAEAPCSFRVFPGNDVQYMSIRPSVVSLKFFVKCVKEQKQILRLTTPELKDVRGPFRSE